MRAEPDKKVVSKLKRIEGQVRGVIGMIEAHRDCLDTLMQLDAIRAALHKVEHDILENHISCCVTNAFKKGGAHEQRAKVEELVKVLGRLAK